MGGDKQGLVRIDPVEEEEGEEHERPRYQEAYHHFSLSSPREEKRIDRGLFPAIFFPFSILDFDRDGTRNEVSK